MICKNKPFKLYDIDEIQKVYHRHAHLCGTVLYSTDGGTTWQSVGMDSGTWDIHNWLFAFIALEPDPITDSEPEPEYEEPDPTPDRFDFAAICRWFGSHVSDDMTEKDTFILALNLLNENQNRRGCFYLNQLLLSVSDKELAFLVDRGIMVHHPETDRVYDHYTMNIAKAYALWQDEPNYKLPKI